MSSVTNPKTEARTETPAGGPADGPANVPVNVPVNKPAETIPDAIKTGISPSQNHAAATQATDVLSAAATSAPPPLDNETGSSAKYIGGQPEEMDTSRQYRSKVNGLGMWSAWERNFSNKLKACLDLVDNAVDAALWDSDDEEDAVEEYDGKPISVRERWKKQSGRIHISTEKHRLASCEYDSDDDEMTEDHGEEKQKDIGVDEVGKKPPPFIVHDVLGAFGGKSKNGMDGRKDGGKKSNDFQLIDDENTLCLHNDCINPVKELRKVLDVYNSDKTESAIGENGVGVKQASAAMSDLSIVITTRIDEEPLLMDFGIYGSNDNSAKRIRKCLVSIGVLAKKMQSRDACMIPSWTLPIEFNIDEKNEKKDNGEREKDGDNPGNDDDDDEMEEGEDFIGDTVKPVLMRALSKITSTNKLLGRSMREFGAAATKNRRNYGIRRLAKHVELMITSSRKNMIQPKPPHPHQYLMIMHKFGKHRSGQKPLKDGKSNEGAIVKARNELDELLRDLADEMPRTYLHIPPAPHFKVKINQKLLKFQYWERHLVELHQIPLIVDRRNDFRTAEDWMIPESEDDTYEITVSIGFDPTRANPHGGSQNSANNVSNSFIGGQACSLLIFSRISGRLFLKHDDARGVLRLTNSGTNYCQGLTIIVDDFEGHLPLTPTKESLAFGMEDYGKIHERNLYAWLGALANVYWTHFHNMYKTKRSLGNAIKSKIDRVKQLEKKKTIELPTLRYGSFSTVEKLCFSRERVRDSIRPYKSDFTKWKSGPSTIIKLGQLSASKPPKKPAPKKRKAADLSTMDGYDSNGNDLMDGAPPSSAFENNAPESNGKGTNQDDAEQMPPRQRLDGRPIRARKEPQRFEDLREAPKAKKRRFSFKDEKGGDARLNKKLRETVDELREALLELNASKATCDDLQMQLEEVEQAGAEESSKISDLKTELNEAEKKHKIEIQKIKEEHAKQIEALEVRLKKVEEISL